MYGPRFEIERADTEKPFTIVMRGYKPGDAEALANLLGNYRVNEFVNMQGSMTIKDEEGWLEKARTDPNITEWIVAVKQDGDEKLIGATSLHRESDNFCNSGIILADTDWWGKGIASVTHRFRTWFAFNELGLYAIRSGYKDGNVASTKALAGVGYVEQGRIWRRYLTGGVWRDEVLLCCYNPAAIPLLWPNGDVPKSVLQAVPKTLKALEFVAEIIKPR